MVQNKQEDIVHNKISVFIYKDKQIFFIASRGENICLLISLFAGTPFYILLFLFFL